jgi:dTMP kinase
MVPEITALWHRLVAQDAVDQAGAALLAAADGAVGLGHRILPALQRGDTVLADRFIYSHIVHFVLRGVAQEQLDRLFSCARQADLILYLSVPPEQALARLRPAGKPDLWESGLDYRWGKGIGGAVRAWHLHPPCREEMERHFLDHQSRAAQLFPRVLPAERTYHLDGRDRPERVLSAAIGELERRFGR